MYYFINNSGDTKNHICTGQRCAGRNYGSGSRRCCTPDEPCDIGEGDCDGPGDGGGHDNHTGCKGNLVCGRNNCRQFGNYYHEKDDCCEKPQIMDENEETSSDDSTVTNGKYISSIEKRSTL